MLFSKEDRRRLDELFNTVDKIKRHLERIDEKIDSIDRRDRQDRCDHESVEFLWNVPAVGVLPLSRGAEVIGGSEAWRAGILSPYFKKCKSCGKVIGGATEEEYKQHQIDQLQAEIEEIKK